MFREDLDWFYTRTTDFQQQFVDKIRFETEKYVGQTNLNHGNRIKKTGEIMLDVSSLLFLFPCAFSSKLVPQTHPLRARKRFDVDNISVWGEFLEHHHRKDI